MLRNIAEHVGALGDPPGDVLSVNTASLASEENLASAGNYEKALSRMGTIAPDTPNSCPTCPITVKSERRRGSKLYLAK